MQVCVATTYSGDSEKAKEILRQFGDATGINEICSDGINIVADVDPAYQPIVTDAFGIENRRLNEEGKGNGQFTLCWGTSKAACTPV
jgi:hypothetical protein